MIAVMCLILCSKFAKNRLSTGLCPDPLGELTALLRPPSWIMGEGSGKERWTGREGKGKKGRENKEERGGSEREKREGIPRIKILAIVATALHTHMHTPFIHVKHVKQH